MLGWIGMMAPAGTPSGILSSLHSNIAASFKDDDARAQLKKMGLMVIANSPADFTRELVSRRARALEAGDFGVGAYARLEHFPVAIN